MKTLIAYFSAEGTTARVAEEAAGTLGADLFEIKPETPYSAADINWKNPLARCNREKFGGKDVPVAGRIEGFDDYDTVLIGFPIWYGGAPNVVNTFCKGYNWYGKKIAAFATSGGSGIGKTADRLMPYVSGGTLVGAKLVHNAEELVGWVQTL
jgi:flavodoxin